MTPTKHEDEHKTLAKHNEDVPKSREMERQPEQYLSARERAQQLTDEQRRELDQRQKTDPLYLEKTRPEDPSGRPGQLTRDNVNPNIPSGERGAPPNAGGIVDPTSLGMPQGGKAVETMKPEHPTDATPEQQRQWQAEREKSEGVGKDLSHGKGQQEAAPEPLRTGSINEPPGSNVYGKPVPEGLGKPVISSIEPNSCAIGDPDFTLDVTGENFFDGSIIFFAGHDEPTSFDGTDTLSTGIKPSLWQSPVVVQVQVRNGSVLSDSVDFTFEDAAGATRATDPDDLEEELDEAIEEGSARPAPHNKKRKR